MLTKEQENILYGSLLGDAQIEKNGTSHRIRFEYGLTAKDYIYWLAKKLNPYSLKVTEYSVYDERTKKKYQKIKFDTKTDPIFSKYRSMFYSSQTSFKDLLPSNIEDILAEPLVLTVWTLDDGAKRTDSNAYRLHTEGFTLKNIEKLQTALSQH